MPVIHGYSRKSFDENLSELRARLPESSALAASYSIGRKAWRRRHGKTEPYPPHLREPNGHLLPHDNPGSGEKVHSLVELRRHGVDYWKGKPTISSGQTHDLKYDDGKHRVWVSRMTADDYDSRAAFEAEKLIFERYFDGRWRRVEGASHVAHGREESSAPEETRCKVCGHRVRWQTARIGGKQYGSCACRAVSWKRVAGGSAERIEHSDAPTETPSESVYWKNIPVGAPVIERRYVFIAKRNDGKWAVAYWEGREALEAQRCLRRWSKEGRRSRLAC